MVQIRKQTIKDLHDEWALTCVPKNALPNQRRDMKRSFYSGVLGLLSLLMKDETLDPEDLIKLMAEMKEFRQAMKDGRE